MDTSERVRRKKIKAGMAKAKARGKHVGRPPLSKKQRSAILKLRRSGLSLRKIATATGCGVSSVVRVCKSIKVGKEASKGTALFDAVEA